MRGMLVKAFNDAVVFNPRPAGRPSDAATPALMASPQSSFNPRPAGRPGDAPRS
jgi:hypothetical protein